MIYRLTGVKPKAEMRWQVYAQAFVIFGMVGTLVLYSDSEAAAISSLVLSPLHDHADDAGSGAEYGRQLLNYDYLASLWRRNHLKLLQPARRPYSAEFPCGSGRLGGGHSVHPWPRA